MSRLRYSADAKTDLTNIAAHIAGDEPIAARRWLSKLREKCRFIASQPDIGDVREELGSDIRATALGRYVIYFRHRASGVEIVRILPGDCDPMYQQL
ncbi:type II toxin-antitoxin system RelE/ParE family toxin [Blastopirellula retiformator]|uniref:type II toxin-antitoxin system RelE/ParE family toxin n=1 Tax=Blastopirellula retiformator TaxID=2527970 RepID=UPI0011B6B067|nr:type II toxin-antitoxin system RelE/ParE family toxin [Blastopirellula retiformator]